MTQKIIATVIVLCLLLISYHCLLLLRWKIEPMKEYYKISKRFGNPSFVNPSSGGVALWKQFGKESPFVRIMIVDEKKPHKKPAPHYDFIYATIKYHIDPKKMMDVRAISDSIMYDRLKEELTVGCRTLEANMATMVMVDLVHKDIITKSHVADGLTYKRYINKSRDTAAINYRILQGIKNEYDIRHPGCVYPSK